MPLVATRGGASAFGLGWSAAGAGEELGGMVLLKPTSITYTGTSASIGTNGLVEFSNISDLRLNGIFSADYDNYLVNVSSATMTTSSDFVYARYMSGSTPDTTSDYWNQYLRASATAIAASRYSFSVFQLGGDVSTSNNSSFTCAIYGPHLAQPTTTRCTGVSALSNGYFSDADSIKNNSTSYDGLNIVVFSSRFLSGEISVFGLVGA